MGPARREPDIGGMLVDADKFEIRARLEARNQILAD
jgi:hypothetical protein